MSQTYTSANTSVNSKKMPKIYSLVMKHIKPNENVIDYGCGKYFDSYGLPENYVGYDPYNKPDEELLDNAYDVAICSNVLNVIAELKARLDVLKKLKCLANTIYISVYEGDKSSVGKETKKDCYQLNRRCCDYYSELKEVFGDSNVKWCGGYYKCKAND